MTTPETVLLTGATGWLGSHVCAEILRSTRATVYCIVRSADRAGATRRLREVIAGLDDAPMPDAMRRVVAVPGDLGQPMLGMAADDYDRLAETVETIVHSAAEVNLVASFEKLKAANVTGTEHLLAFAHRVRELLGDTVHFHFVSTLAVLAEHDVAVRNSGYPQSKAAAEAAVRRAGSRGLRVTIHRPGVVTAHSRTGRASGTDLSVPMLRAAIALGTVPAVRDDVIHADMIDVVARAIVAIALSAPAMSESESVSGTYHLVRPTPISPTAFFDAVRRAGIPLDVVPESDWWADVHRHARHPEVRPIAMMSELYRYVTAFDADHPPPRYQSEETWSLLTRLGLSVPAYDTGYFDNVVANVLAETPS